MWQGVLRIITGLAIVGLVAGCGLVEGNGKANQPLSASAESRLKMMGSSPAQPMLVRLFKESSELEVWKRTSDGDYKLFKTYEICAWSGDLGPKFKEGDRQSPEGFYNITPGLMNPNSSYYLSVNTGFPNKFDRVWGRTGSDLMIHGDCSSRGCYAMTDEQIAEIYVLAREAFKGGQRKFQVQLYPFRMTAANLAKHRNSPHLDFWRNLKIGYDAFELSHRPPEWDVCEKKYVFNAPGDGQLNPAGVCPSGSTQPELMAKVEAKQITDNSEFKLASANLDDKAAQRQEEEARKLEEAQAIAQRTAAVNAAVAERREAVTGAVTSFFGNIFGGGEPAAPMSTMPGTAAEAANTAGVSAPQPAPPIR